MYTELNRLKGCFLFGKDFIRFESKPGKDQELNYGSIKPDMHFIQKEITLYFAVCVVLLSGGNMASELPPALPSRQVIDFQNLNKNQTVALNGSWEFYRGRLLTPSDFSDSEPPAPDSLVNLPGSWWGLTINETRLPMDGCATYRMTLVGLKQFSGLGLKLTDIAGAYRVWADTLLLSSSGSMGPDGGSVLGEEIIRLPETAGDSVTLLLQVSNYSPFPGGVLGEIVLGNYDRLKKRSVLYSAFLYMTIAILFVLGLYHIQIFLFRHKETPSLYLGAYCITASINTLAGLCGSFWCLNFESRLIHILVGRIDSISLIISVPLWIAYLHRILPDAGGKKSLEKWTWFIAVIFTFSAIIPFRAGWAISYRVHYLVLAALAMYTMYYTLKAVMRKLPNARLAASGSWLICIAGIHEILKALGVSTPMPYMLWPSLTVMLLFQSYIVLHRFAGAYSKVEQLSEELIHKNKALSAMNKLEKQLTERMEAEAELKLWHNCLSEMLHSIDYPVCAIKADKIIAFCNQAFAKLADRPVDELIGMNASNILSDKWNNSGQHDTDEKKCDAQDEETIDGKNTAERDAFQILRPDGSYRLVWAQSTVLGEKKEQIRILSLRTQHLDLTEKPLPSLALIQELSRNRNRLNVLRETFANITPALTCKSGHSLDLQLKEIDILLEEMESLFTGNSFTENRNALAAQVMRLSLACWTETLGKDRLALAQESGLWKIHINQDGFERAQTLDRYLDASRFPKFPRISNIIYTAEFVLERCTHPSHIRTLLQQSLLRLRLFVKK
jgi:PAS domain-containing protein